MTALIFLLFLGLSLATLGSTQDAVVDNSKPTKYAPKYCLRFRLNCQDKAKSGHVCCRFPLPPSDFVPNEVKPNPGGINIRPIVLPSHKDNVSQMVNDTTVESSTNESGAVVDETEDSANHRSQLGIRRKSPLLLRRKSPVVSQHIQSESQEKKSSPFVGRTRVNIARKKPRLCLRLVINCNTSPDHMCCQNYDEQTTTTTATTTTTTTKTTTGPEAVDTSTEDVSGQPRPVEEYEYTKVFEDEYEYEAEKIPKRSNIHVTKLPAICFSPNLDCKSTPDLICCQHLEN